VQALVKSASDVKYDFRILDAVMEVNEKQKVYLIPRIKKYFNNNVTGKKIALWGLAFKPNTDDIREAPALYLIEELLKAGAAVTAFDPEAMKNVRDVVGDKISFTENQYDALNNCDALIIATEWSEFRTPDFEKMTQRMKSKVIFDGRNVFDLSQMKDLGFYYESIGRKTIVP
jgi:UDPglucose 6-dehydrogenase